MISRRCRIQAKPNLKKPPEPKPPPAILVMAASGSGDHSSEQMSEAVMTQIRSPIPHRFLLSPGSPSTSTSVMARSPLLQPSRSNSPSKMTGKSVFRTVSHAGSLSRPSSPMRSPSVCKRKNFTGDEELDPKTMTMSDLINWNPNNNTGLVLPGHEGKKSNRGRKLTKNRPQSPTKSPTKQPRSPSIAEKTAQSSAIAAPQIKISADGSVIVDEESLTVHRKTRLDEFELVEEGRLPRKISCLSFRNRPWRKGTAWTELETDFFYKILSATGPDFTLMHNFFQSRSRAELKSKFNREEKANPRRINESMQMPATLNDELYIRAKEFVDACEMLKDNKKRQRDKEKQSRLEKESLAPWNEMEADLVAEAADEIRRLQQDELTSRPMVNSMLEEAHKEAIADLTRKRKLRLADAATQWKSYLRENLGDDFPAFDVIETKALTVSIEANPNGPPIVRVPQKTRLLVLAADAEQPIRVLFQCPPSIGQQGRQFLIQHQMRANEPSTGFLHLFGSAD